MGGSWPIPWRSSLPCTAPGKEQGRRGRVGVGGGLVVGRAVRVGVIEAKKAKASRAALLT